ncbi:hypothetical protein HY031_00045 [Candidatus Gottesmanbacteria bacterium]|nr:hypothetical protein [Candidatus Gottesmanbacteria bacterium]
MNYRETKSKILAAEKLLSGETTTFDKFRSAQALLKNIHPELDNALGKVSTALNKLEKIQKGQFIELTADGLPEETEEQRKRKKLLLFLVRSWRDLQSEVKRIEHEIESSNLHTPEGQESALVKILSAVKGPFGIITIAAIVVVGGILWVNRTKVHESAPQTASPSPSGSAKIQVITVSGQHIRVIDLEIGTGSDCDAPHYHAKDLVSVKSVEGKVLFDPGGCGFGKVADSQITLVDAP